MLLGGHDFLGLGLFGLFDLFAFELQVLLVLDVDLDEVLALELAGEHRLGERVLDVVLDRPTQRPSAELRIVAFVDQEFLGLPASARA